MRERVVHHLLVLAFGLAAWHWCGCIAIYARREVTIRVIDLETNAPVPDASIRVDYDRLGATNAPEPDHAMTDVRGEARMLLARYNPGITWVVSKGGFVPQHGTGVLGDQAPSNWQEPPLLISDRVVNVIPLLRNPAAHGTVIIPQGFRGVIVLRRDVVGPPPVAAVDAGQREFEVTANVAGVVLLPARGAAAQATWEDFRYRDGVALARDFPFGAPYLGLDRVYDFGWHDGRVYFIGSQPDALRLYEFVNGFDYPPRDRRHGSFDSTRLKSVIERGGDALPAAATDSTTPR